jgi:hypothetical protein
MSNSYSKPGSRYVPEFQASGFPFVTRSTSTSLTVDFPYITQWITVQNLTATILSAAFTNTGFSTGNFFTIGSNTKVGPINLAINKIYFSSSFSNFTLAAGLTMIPANSYELVSTGTLPTLTGALSVTDTNYFSYRGI